MPPRASTPSIRGVGNQPDELGDFRRHECQTGLLGPLTFPCEHVRNRLSSTGPTASPSASSAINAAFDVMSFR